MFPELPCQIASLNLGCFGCCGRLYLEKEKVVHNIHKNTLAWQQRDDKMTLRDFCFRQTALTQSGVCANVIEENKMFVCAVHPMRKENVKEQDPREKYCNTKFLCALAKKYIEWDAQTKELFLAFLKQKTAQGMDSYAYSMANDKDLILTEFEKMLIRKKVVTRKY